MATLVFQTKMIRYVGLPALMVDHLNQYIYILRSSICDSLSSEIVLYVFRGLLKLLSANPTKWSNTFKQFFGKLPTNCLSVFDHFLKLALKGLLTPDTDKKKGTAKFLRKKFIPLHHGLKVGLSPSKKSIFLFSSMKAL